MSWGAGFFSKIRWSYWVKKLPYPLRVAIVLCIGYYTLLGDTLDGIRLVFELPGSSIRILRWTYITLAVTSLVLLVFASLPLAGRLARLRGVLTWPVRLTVAAAVAGVVGIALTIARGPQTTLTDSQRIAQATECVAGVQRLLEESIAREAAKVQRDLENVLAIARALDKTNGAAGNGSMLAALRNDPRYTVENAFRRIIVLGDWKASATKPAFVDMAPRGAGSEAPSYARELIQGPLDRRERRVWLAHTSIGPLAAAALPDASSSSLWIAAAPWTERDFLTATAPYWQDETWGISLIAGDQRVLYTSEVSEFGEPLNGRAAPSIGDKQLTEVQLTDGVQYLFQETIQSPMIGRVTMLLRLPPEVAAGWLDYAKIALSLLVLLISAIAFLAEETEPSEDRLATGARVNPVAS
jgi:hypothetical protein